MEEEIINNSDEEKIKNVKALRWLLFLGVFGAHNFYLKDNKRGIVKLISSTITFLCVLIGSLLLVKYPIASYVLYSIGSLIFLVLIPWLIIEIIDISNNKYETGTKAGSLIACICTGLIGFHHYYRKNGKTQFGNVYVFKLIVMFLLLGAAFLIKVPEVTLIFEIIGSLIFTNIIFNNIIDFFKICFNKLYDNEPHWINVLYCLLLGIYGSHNFVQKENVKGIVKIFLLCFATLFAYLAFILPGEVEVIIFSILSSIFSLALVICLILDFSLICMNMSSKEMKVKKELKENDSSKKSFEINLSALFDTSYILITLVINIIFTILIFLDPLKILSYGICLIVLNIFIPVFLFLTAFITKKYTKNNIKIIPAAKIILISISIIGVIGGIGATAISETKNTIYLAYSDFYLYGDPQKDIIFSFDYDGHFKFKDDSETEIYTNYTKKAHTNEKFLINGVLIKYTGDDVNLFKKGMNLWYSFYICMDIGGSYYLIETNTHDIYTNKN